MDKYVIYKSFKNNERISKPYGDLKFFDEYLRLQAHNFNYIDLEILLKQNIKKIFDDEVNQIENSFYSGILAYGEVQSGKTANMIASTIWAYDNGFKFIFVFTGNLKPLHQQTIKRFTKEINELNDFFANPEKFNKLISKDMKKILHSKINKKIQIEILNLQENFDDFFIEKLHKEKLNIFFVLKNVESYEKVNNLIRSTPKDNARNGVLVLDDEADWGFSNGFESNEKPLFNELKKIKKNCLDKELYLKYVGFTATPYKILENYKEDLINQNVVILNSKSHKPWMSEEFIKDNDPFYCGINIFYKNKEKFNDDILNRNFITIIEDDSYKVNSKNTLKFSLLIYLINAFLFNNSSKISSTAKTHCLYFPNISKEVHNETYKMLLELIPELINEIKDIIENFNLLKNDNFIDFVLNKLTKNVNIQFTKIEKKFQEKLLENNNFQNRTMFQYVLKWLKISRENPKSFIVKMSGNENDTNKFEKKKSIDGIWAIFIIGGFKIARGVTFDNLLLETILTKSEQEDSTLQRARWFGYRTLQNLDNLDLIMTKEVYKSFNKSIENDISWRKLYEGNNHDK